MMLSFHPHFYIALYALVTVGIIMVLLYYAISRRKNFFNKNISHHRKLERMREHPKNDHRVKKTIDERDPFELLGLNPSSNKEEILRAYKKKLKLYHPDAVSHRGIEFAELAKQKTIQLQMAKDFLIHKLEGKSH